MCNFVVQIIFEMKNVGNCEEEVSILEYIVCRRERERERERENRGSTCFLCYPAISNPHFPSLQDEAKIERETEKAAIKFSISSLCPKFLHLRMHLSLPVT